MGDRDCSDFELTLLLEAKPRSGKDLQADGDQARQEEETGAPDNNTAADDWESRDFDIPLLNDKSQSTPDKATEGIQWEDEIEGDDLKAKEHFLEGEIDAPDVERLSQALCCSSIMKPSSLLVVSWICPNCWIIHDGSINYFANIQDYECVQCLMKNPVSYEWTLTRCYLNGVSLNFSIITNQLAEPTCILHAFISLCDIYRRIRGAKRQCDEGMPFDLHLMHRIFESVSGYRLENEAMHTDGFRAIESMLIAACRHGVPYSYRNAYYRKKLFTEIPSGTKAISLPRRSLKVVSWFRVSASDVEKLTRLIAHGFALLSIIPVGKCFIFLSGDEVYSAPDPNGCVRHAVVLHGSGVGMPKTAIRKAKPGEAMQRQVYFRGRNSHGKWAHPSVDGKGEGADFNIWAVHLLGYVYGINLATLDF